MHDDPIPPGPADIRAEVAALRETFPRHRFVLVGERSIQVTRQDDTRGFPAGS
jgi:hypothetical protein